MKNKKRVLKTWVEKVLLTVFAINFLLLVGINDISSFKGLLVIGAMIGNLFVVGNILAKYGRFFADYKETL